MPMALVTPVETDRIPGQQSPHQSSEGNFAPPQKKVSRIRKKFPGLASRPCLQQKLTQPFKKILTIAFVPKDLSAFNAPDDNRVKNSRDLKKR